MVPEILLHIEQLQVELASVDPYGRSASVAMAVAQIAESLRCNALLDDLIEEASAPSNGQYRPVFMQ